ncbi:hypothetical protein AB7W30_03920 [Providencia manganoxydans]|uniref:Uncharacterized protein n=2 Tax=Providencia manganoxydans TaxID=2923283 RepID=A0ABX7ABW9_9GAMM|nr:hypothetical protein [Providencia manganoxydans]MDX4946560.1 hypothetical protein [Providencia manganoxydans]QQO61450.1 hypothetical protein JI723_14390 [Providencia manganoxydans]
MPNKKINYSIKFNQYQLIEYFHKTPSNEFTKKIIGIENINYTDGGLCYGLTDRFLVNVYKNKEIHFIQEIISILNLVAPSCRFSYPASYQQKKFISYHNAHLNQLFHKIFRAQFNQDISIDIRNAIHQFKYPPINKNEGINNYIDRIIDENIKNLSKSKKILTPYFHEIKILIKKVNRYIKSNISNISTTKNYHDNFSILSEKISSHCFSSKKKYLLVSKIELFFYFIGQYFSHEIIRKTEFNNNLEGVSYDNSPINLYVSMPNNDIVSLDTLKKMIEKYILKNQVFACDLCDKNHAMAITVKPLTNCNKTTFELFDPNKGVFITKNKSDFFELLKKIINKKNSNFLIDKDGVRKIEITRKFIIDKNPKNKII